jgi:methylated-DNA-[protein]-cysteine S-methyltransferase
MIASTMSSTPARRREHMVTGSPIGPLTLVSEDGSLAGLYMDRQRYAPGPQALGEAAGRGSWVLDEAASQLKDYFARKRTTFDLPLTTAGTPFQRRVWAALREIPYGETISYGQLADRIGQPSAARAVGLANGKNPIGIIVPCHRVVGANGSLTGYGGGLERKEHLLAFERGVKQRGLTSGT